MNDKLENFIVKNKDNFNDLEPSKIVFKNIEAAIKEKSVKKYFVVSNFWSMGIAASICFIIGLSTFWFFNNTTNVEEKFVNTYHKNVGQVVHDTIHQIDNTKTDPSDQIVKLELLENMTIPVNYKTKEITQPKSVKYHIVNTLTSSTSASDRYNAASKALENIKLDMDIVDVLFRTMQTDESTNVRMAVFESLSLFANEKNIKDRFIKALSTQDDPTVKVAIIELLTNLRVNKINDYLEKITRNQETDPMIIEKAHQGLLRLQS
ncbi:MAG TPA: HEAT repeat domain-containing protein [Saprospiraceae bacterium]|nr:HEAT repeat domain-containing protein [Saprospiraceae bacterium]